MDYPRVWSETTRCMECGRPIFRHHYIQWHPDAEPFRLLVDHLPDPKCGR